MKHCHSILFCCESWGFFDNMAVKQVFHCLHFIGPISLCFLLELTISWPFKTIFTRTCSVSFRSKPQTVVGVRTSCLWGRNAALQRPAGGQHLVNFNDLKQLHNYPTSCLPTNLGRSPLSRMKGHEQ